MMLWWHGDCPICTGSCCVLDVFFALARNIKQLSKCNFDDAVSANMVIAHAKKVILWSFIIVLITVFWLWREERNLSN